MSDETKPADLPKKIRILLDEPVGADEAAQLGFEDYADVLAGVIVGSDSPFTVGIFGDWGTGKTTLMHCIKRRLEPLAPGKAHEGYPTIIPVWFEAWRYEREEDLIAPLLGEIADALNRHKSRLKRNGQEIARLLDSLATGLSIKFSLGDVVGIELEGEKMIKRYEELLDALPGSSEYRNAYRALGAALSSFAKDGGSDNKIVVFVDDLDRCLPEPAVAVLEATKVFLGFPGMVYVLGLKTEIVQKCIERRYCRTNDGDEAEYESDLGKRYIDKLVQVPFSVPTGTPADMAQFVKWLMEDQALPEDLGGVFRMIAEPADMAELYDQFDARAGSHGPVEVGARFELAVRFLDHNPRTIKRALNAYMVSSAVAQRVMRSE